MRDLLIGHGRHHGAAPPALERSKAATGTALTGHFPFGRMSWPDVEHARGVLRQLIGEAEQRDGPHGRGSGPGREHPLLAQ